MGTKAQPDDDAPISTDALLRPVDENGDPLPDARPGVVLISENRRPVCRAFGLNDGQSLMVGRARTCDLVVSDTTVSSEHLVVSCARGTLTVQDHASRHGTMVNGAKITTATPVAANAVISLGQSILLVHDDVSVFDGGGGVSVQDDYAVGPRQAAVWAIARTAAAANVPLLVQGESGSGKERTARVYHEAGRRRRGPFVTVNAGLLDKAIARGELFGTKRGAYTGAEDKPGRFVEADGGTMLLDEIGDLDLPVQVQLLRVLQTGEVEPVGGGPTRRVDVGIVAATHRDLHAMVEAGTFREDLLRRIEHGLVELPPLRERREEIPFVIAITVERTCRNLGRAPMDVDVEFTAACVMDDYAGENVRGLIGVVERAVVLAHRAGASALMAKHRVKRGPGAVAKGLATVKAAVGALRKGKAEKKRIALEALRAEMARNGGHVVKAAEAVGISKSEAYLLLRDAGG